MNIPLNYATYAPHANTQGSIFLVGNAIIWAVNDEQIMGLHIQY